MNNQIFEVRIMIKPIMHISLFIDNLQDNHNILMKVITLVQVIITSTEEPQDLQRQSKVCR